MVVLDSSVTSVANTLNRWGCRAITSHTKPSFKVGRKTKLRKTFADIDAARPRYNPDVDGFGSAHDWNSAFYERMGFEEAEKVLYGKGKLTPRTILGVGATATWKEITSAFRAMAMKCHPDRISFTGMTVEAATETFKIVSAAYAVLAREFGK